MYTSPLFGSSDSPVSVNEDFVNYGPAFTSAPDDDKLITLCDRKANIFHAFGGGWKMLGIDSNQTESLSFCDLFNVPVSVYKNVANQPVTIHSFAKLDDQARRFEHIIVPTDGDLLYCISRVEDIKLTYNRMVDLVSELNYTIETLKKNNEQKDNVLAVLAHDLRGPVASLSGYAALLADEESNPELAAAVDTIRKQLIAVNTTINNLLTWASRQFDGEVKVIKEELNITDIVAECVELQTVFARSKSIQVDNNVTEPRYIRGDKGLLDIVIRNVLTNAIKFTPEFGKIQLSVHSNDKYVTVIIADNGVGIAPQNLENLFSDNQVSARGTNGEKGFGMGLKMCRRYMEIMDGQMHVESTQGVSTTVKLQFIIK